MLQTKRWVVLALTALLTTSCNKLKAQSDAANPTTSPAETALATINSIANDSEGINFTLAGENNEFTPDFAVIPAENLMKPACKAQSAKSDCNSSNQVSVIWGECSAANGSTLSGGWTNTYSSTNACLRGKVGPLASGDSVTRTSSGMSIDGVYGGRVTWSTELHTAYDGTTISNAGITISKINDTRMIQIAGLHRILENGSGQKIYDHSIKGLSQLNMTGARSNGTRVLNNGTVRVFNNLQSLQSDLTFSDLEWRKAACCYPTAGTITTVTSGATKYESTTIRFDRTQCGQASLEGGGKSTLITLQQCE